MRKQIAAFASIITIVSVAIAIVHFSHISKNSESSINLLERTVQREDPHFLQITLEGCPACQILDEEKANSGLDFSDMEVITVPIDEKEGFRTSAKNLIPSFTYYPSIYLIDNGNVVGEFDLSSLENFAARYSEWKSSVLGTKS